MVLSLFLALRKIQTQGDEESLLLHTSSCLKTRYGGRPGDWATKTAMLRMLCLIQEYPETLEDAQSILAYLISSLSDLLGNMLHCLPMLGPSQELQRSKQDRQDLIMAHYDYDGYL